MSTSDDDLLQDFARNGSQAAFAELVDRHLTLVYSAARRQVRSAQLAEEVAQSVFIDLSRQAAGLKRGTPLVAWLHRVTRHTSIDVIRKESRRQIREQIALEISPMKSSPSIWTEMEPLLDEAMESLGETDRTALLLRYFENKSLREVGQFLGASEGATQKRVSRALEQLRSHFGRRGIAVTAAGLTSELCAHAILVAPPALGSAIAVNAATLGVTAIHAAAIEATKTFAMTTLQKSAAGAVIALAVGSGLYQVVGYAHQNAELGALEHRAMDLTSQLHAAQTETANAASRLKSVEAQIDARLAWSAARLSSGDAALEAQMKSWLANLDRIKSILKERPNQDIPELQLLSEEAWFNAAAGANLETDEGVRRALAGLRQSAENQMVNKTRNALSAYLVKNAGALPSHVSQLAPYFDPPIDPTWLDRYEITGANQSRTTEDRKRMSFIAVKAPVDVEYDTYWRVGLEGGMTTGALSFDIREAQRAFSAAHSGQRSSRAVDLLPYLKWPVSEAAVQKSLRLDSTNSER